MKKNERKDWTEQSLVEEDSFNLTDNREHGRVGSETRLRSILLRTGMEVGSYCGVLCFGVPKPCIGQVV